ncbi:MAG: DUF433 domain-containing protein [Firmicutes bacterium]|nr:DUF433 domain-containing protein [Bacillota bacterium]
MLVKDKNTCEGKLRIEGTRLTYEFVMEILKQMTIYKAIQQYPSLTLDGIIDCLNELRKKDNKC